MSGALPTAADLRYRGSLMQLPEILALLQHPEWQINRGVQQFMDDTLPGPQRWRARVSVRT